MPSGIFRRSIGLLLWSVSALSLSAQEPAAAGLQDLVVYTPAAHDRGLPAVQFNDVKGGMQVDIPPAVHVHRFYYSGDKEFQGPIITGGPTVVVANHPRTGERMYIDVVLPAGAPRISYDKRGITYVYPKQRVTVNFRGLPFGADKAVVKNRSGRGWGRRMQEANKGVGGHVREGMGNSQLVQSLKSVGKDTGELLKGATVSLGEFSSQGADGLKSLTDMIPGVVYLRSKGEQKPELDYKARIRSAARQKDGELPNFVPTNR